MTTCAYYHWQVHFVKKKQATQTGNKTPCCTHRDHGNLVTESHRVSSNNSEDRDGHINDWGKKTISTAPKRRTKTFKIKVSTTLNQTTVNSARARHVYFSRLATDHKGQRAIILRSSTQGTNICSLLKKVRSPEILWHN